MMNVGKFKDSKVFLSEDILATWSRSGSIFYESASGHINKRPYREYQHWIDLPWPQSKDIDHTGISGTD